MLVFDNFVFFVFGFFVVHLNSPTYSPIIYIRVCILFCYSKCVKCFCAVPILDFDSAVVFI
jgi:hypothetical protein